MSRTLVAKPATPQLPMPTTSGQNCKLVILTSLHTCRGKENMHVPILVGLWTTHDRRRLVPTALACCISIIFTAYWIARERKWLTTPWQHVQWDGPDLSLTSSYLDLNSHWKMSLCPLAAPGSGQARASPRPNTSHRTKQCKSCYELRASIADLLKPQTVKLGYGSNFFAF